MAAVDPLKNGAVNYVAQLSQTQAASTEAATKIAAQNDIIANATQADVTGANAVASAKSMVQAATDSTQLQVSAAKLAEQTALGANSQAGNYRLDDLTAQREAAYSKTNELAKTIADKQSMTLLNDPLGFINAQFTLPADIAQHNYYAGIHNAAENEYNTIVNQADSTARMITATAATQTTAGALGAQQKITADNQQEIAKITTAGAGLAIKGAQDLNALSQQDLQNTAQTVSVADAQSRMKMQQANAAAMLTQRKVYLGILEDRLEAANTKMQGRTDATNAYNMAAQAKGFPALPAEVIIRKLEQKDPTTQQWVGAGQDMILNGNSAEGVPLAASPAAAGSLLAKTPRLIPTGTSAPVETWLAQTVAGFEANPEIAKEKDPEAKLASINTKLSAELQSQATSIVDGKFNINNAPPPAALLSAVPALANNSFIQSTIVPRVSADPNAPTRNNDLFMAGATTVANNPDQLSNVVDGIYGYYQAAINYNNKMTGRKELGIPLQVTYPAAIKTGFLGRTQTIDMSDKKAIQAAIMRATIPPTLE